MKKSDRLLVNTYATFLVNPSNLDIVEYNDYAGRYLSSEKKKISDIIYWDKSISKRIDFENEKKIIYSSRSKTDELELIVVIQVVNYHDVSYYNVILIDNLEDIKDFESQSIDDDISSNGLFTNIFQYSPIGLVLVDSQTKLVRANKYMFDCFDLNHRDNINEGFGNVFGCSTVSDTGFLCGQHEKCQTCKLRNGIDKVLNDKLTMEGVDLGHDFNINGRIVTKWFTISASPVQYGDSTYALFSFVDITQRVRMEERLRELGITDALTKLYNRRHIIKLFEEALLSDEHEHLSVALIDIDDFKIVNDVYGHLVGDEVLILLGEILKEQLRFSDCVGRYGGEEFLIIFNNTEMNTAKVVLERIQKSFREKSLDILDEAATFSAGLTQATIKDLKSDNTMNKILNLADKQMYRAKAMGKDRIKEAVYNEE
ncbi:diguanylate cyclase [Acidaminobacter sp. JC074]|uniref:sensor domain-containing diguanylate cyclase n=1 Tax=Acidaminobacter sp. JC074 TaxID=2530199 RepID=UPI001F1044E9|nr:sensor domain-containing diguanylate cyclase [Acidaminobacter sp. JC074]MCH4891132.1 diguanylate cyclase [Acidaminobacter sp. JC074]